MSISNHTKRRKRRKQIWNTQPHVCIYCGQELPHRKDATIDHLIPIARGGTHALTNLAIACSPCNMAKADLTPEEFAEFVDRNGGIERTKELFGHNPESKLKYVEVFRHEKSNNSL